MSPVTRARRAKKGQPPEFPHIPAKELRRIGLFSKLGDAYLNMLQGHVRHVTAVAKETILDLSDEGEPFRFFFFVAKGQVKVMGLDEDAAFKPINFLRKGDVFIDKSFSWKNAIATKIVAITDCELFVVPRIELKHMSDQVPAFVDALTKLTDRIDFRNRVYSEDETAQSALSFLINTGLTQASRIKITQMDKCIECDTCYDSCEARHGFQRLERGFANFGVLDIAKSCLTCFYPTCIPACPVDSILYNTDRGEVEILDSCIGCTACERACEYGAIKMYGTEPENVHHQRFLSPEKKIQPKFIADKCNHCFGFDDLACVASCPTGAIVEVDAGDLLENPTLFGVGNGKNGPMMSRLEAGPWLKRLQWVYLMLGVLGTAFLFWEAFALSRWPGLSILRHAQDVGWLASGYDIRFARGSQYCVFLGNLGFALILLAMLYPLRKAFPRVFKYLGKKPYWLDFHNFCGLMGVVLIFMHTGWVFPSHLGLWAFVALFAVMASGTFGRFLYQVIPRGVAGTELKTRDIGVESENLMKKMDALFGASVAYRTLIDSAVERILSSQTVKTKRSAKETKEGEKKSPPKRRNEAATPRRKSFSGLVRAVIQTRFEILRIKMNLPKELKEQKRVRAEFTHLVEQRLKLERNTAFLDYTSKLFLRWQYIHKPFAYIMGSLSILHIIYNLLFFRW